MRQNQDTQKRSNLKSFIIIGLLLLLVAVIGFGGYTLSKYLTSKSEKGNASVAKWGFTISTEADDLFSKKYSNGSVVADATTDNLTVSAASKAVAPGTSGSMTFSIKGSAEVLAQIKIEIAQGYNDIVLKYTETDVEGTQSYAPIKWTLKKNGTVVTNANGVSLAEIVDKLNATTTYVPGTTAQINDSYELSWAWDFDENGTGTNDALDTLLGMYSNSNTATTNGKYTVAADTITEISFTLNISVTQLQNAQ